MQSVFSWAPKEVRKCENKHWFFCGTDERSLGVRSVGVRSRDYQIFWDGSIYLAMGLRPSRTRGAALRSNFISRNFTLAVPIFFLVA